LPHLFEPLTVCGITFRNRIVMSPTRAGRAHRRPACPRRAIGVDVEWPAQYDRAKQ